MRDLKHLPDLNFAARVGARLDSRLERNVSHPLAVALSGGGDSMALLDIVAEWAGLNGRRLLVITVDHGLNAESPRWNAFCETAARRVGAKWHLCRWQGDKPATGLPAAARAARHALIADVARDAGAKVILFAHTADDVAEGDWMRSQGSTLGQLREWAPSPAWPEGRGLMVFRPLLDERRETLRQWLVARERAWIEDPANADDRFARSRARNALASGAWLDRAGTADPAALISRLPGDPGSPPSVQPLTFGAGFVVARSTDPATLAAALLCASGIQTPPRSDRLGGLVNRLRSAESFVATLAGARVTASGDTVTIGREPGRPTFPETTPACGQPVVWDNRFQISTFTTDCTIAAGKGRLNLLSGLDRAVLKTVPASLRPTLPVLIRDDGSAPVLAWRAARVLALGPRRLSLALGETTQECHLHATIHGETPPTDLLSIQELHQGGPHQPPTNRETR